MYADNEHYRLYQRMLVELHRLIAQGRGEDPEALSLREEMEVPEKGLSDDELICLNQLSGDLALLHDRDVPDPEILNNTPPTEVPKYLAAAFIAHDWKALLRVLRADLSGIFAPEQLAYTRSRAYAALGEFPAAIAFMDEAARRATQNENYPALAMELLWADSQFDEAYARAKLFVSEAGARPRIVLMAGGIICRRAHQDDVPRDISAVVTQAIDPLRVAVRNTSEPALLLLGHGVLGLLAAYAGDQAEAETALQNATAIEAQDARQLAAQTLLAQEIAIIRAGNMQTLEGRSIARNLAALVVPDVMSSAA